MESDENQAPSSKGIDVRGGGGGGEQGQFVVLLEMVHLLVYAWPTYIYNYLIDADARR